MTEITTLSQFLATAKTQFQVYDLGRRVQHIDMMTFHQIEALQAPYPYPIQGHAQFAVVFWSEEQQHYIWFIKLALDEKGLFVPAARQQFIKMILEALGRDPAKPLSEKQQRALANNPFSFKPSQEKLAVFNALVKKQMGLPASAQYEMASQYLSGQMPKENWQQLGLQGIADICVRLNSLDHERQVISGLQSEYMDLQAAICRCLEHINVTDNIADQLFDNFNRATPEIALLFLKALSGNQELSLKAVTFLLHGTLTDQALITIAARNWTVLKNDKVRLAYLESLAMQPQRFFNQVFADIVAIPQLREKILSELRNPNRSVKLSQAIGGLFRTTMS